MKERTAESVEHTVLRAEKLEDGAMREDTATDHQLFCNDEQSQKISCGCLFCITGKEQSVETRFRPPALMYALRPCNS